MQTHTKTSRLRAALLVLAVLAAGAPLLPRAVAAQAVTGVGDDATIPKKGELRISFGSIWNSWYERYGQGTPGRPNGTLEPLGINFNFDTIGVAQFENLGAVQSSIRTLAGMPGFTASLGSSNVQLHDDLVTTPFSLEVGIMKWLSLSAMVPFVTATSHVNFVMNPTGLEPTLGFNPTLFTPAVAGTDALFLAQFDSAAAQLNRSIATCAATPSAPGCTAVNANLGAERALIANANGFASGLAQVYGGRTGSTGMLFVPLEGTAAQSAIEAKVAAYKAMYAAYGTTAITATGPIGAQTPLTAGGMQTVLTDPRFGINAKPLATAITRGIGNMEFGAKVKLLDSFHGNDSAMFTPKGFNWRQSFGGSFRLGTNAIPGANDLTGLGAGDHQSSMQFRTFTDLFYGRHFWISLVAGYTSQLADQIAVRLPDNPNQVILAAYRQDTVQRKMGDIIDVQINPRWTVNNYLLISGQYYYRHKASDVYTGVLNTADLNQNPIRIDASVLGEFTEMSESRLGIGATYSTVATVARIKSGLPFDISYFHYETTLGSIGRVPKISVDQVTMRIYQRLFGR
jgi:hypothetical protein